MLDTRPQTLHTITDYAEDERAIILNVRKHYLHLMEQSQVWLGVFSTPWQKKSGAGAVFVIMLTVSGLSACSIKPQWLELQEKAQVALKEGQPGAAKALLTKSIDSANRGGQPFDAAESYRRLALVTLDMDSSDPRSTEIAERALELGEQKYGINNVNLVPFLVALGQVKYRHHDFSGAEALFSRALSLHDAAGLKDDAEFGEVIGGLISASCAGGKCIDAEPLYKRLISVRTKQLGANHEHTISAVMMYAENCERRNKYTQGRELYMDCIARAQRTSPKLLPTLLTCVGRLYNREGRYVEAEQALNAANRLISMDPGASGQYRTLNELATSYAKQNRRADAERYYKLAIASAARTACADSPEAEDLRQAYATFLKQAH